MPKSSPRKQARARARRKPKKKRVKSSSISSAALHALQLTADKPDLSMREASEIVGAQRRFKPNSVLSSMKRIKAKRKKLAGVSNISLKFYSIENAIALPTCFTLIDFGDILREWLNLN